MSTIATNSQPGRASARSGRGRGGKGSKSSAKTKSVSPTTTAKAKRVSAKSKAASAKAANKDGGRRLSPGQLDGMVLGWMKKNRRKLPVTASAVARGVRRSSGAVANCLDRLERAEEVRLVEEKPRRYDLAGSAK
jgi:hypothetical protein